MSWKFLSRITKQTSKKVLNLSLARVIGISGMFSAVPFLFPASAAAAPTLAPASQPCDVAGTPIITITQNISNDPDSATAGGTWATDAFTENVSVWLGTD